MIAWSEDRSHNLDLETDGDARIVDWHPIRGPLPLVAGTCPTNGNMPLGVR